MAGIGESVGAVQMLAGIDTLLDRLAADRSGVDAAGWLEVVRLSRRVRQRVEAVTDVLIAEADRVQAAERAKGTPLASWLGTQETLSRREAKSAVFRARQLAGHPRVAEAATKGQIGAGQARAIGTVLDALEAELNPAQHNAAEQVLLELSGHLDSDQLTRAAPQVLAQVAPATADELLERKLQREAETAHRQRSLRFWGEAGSIRFDGSLPRVEGERFISLIEASAEQLRRTAIEARDPLAVRPTIEQRRADALMGVLRAAEAGNGGATAPAGSTDGGAPAAAARVIVKLDYDKLRQMASGAGLIGADQPISAGELRRLCCGAELIPAVLGGESEVLDVGRTRRLATKAIWTGLILRDAGCAFPGCTVGPQLCEAHHVRPWWDGGDTQLDNLVLLCHSHHGLCEPARHTTRDQWQIRVIGGRPEFIPPARYDPAQTPIRERQRWRDPTPVATTGRPTEAEPLFDTG